MSRRHVASLLIVFGVLLVAAAVVLRGLETRPRRSQHYTEADVHAFITPGITRRDEVLSRFGQPIFVEPHPKYEDGVTREDEIIYFSVDPPPEAVNGRYGFAGFSVGIKDGVATVVHISTGTVHKR